MESASPDRPSEPPPGHLANLIGLAIAMLTLTLPLYAVSNFNAAQAEVAQPSSSAFMRAQE